MISKNTIGILAGLSALYYAVLRGANALFVSIQGYRLSSFNTEAGTFTVQLDFLISNPLFVGLKLKGLSGDVYVQGIKCGNVDMTYDYYLAGRHKHIVPVMVVINTANLTDAIIANMKTGNINTLTISFDGGLTIGSELVYIPLQKTIDWQELRG